MRLIAILMPLVILAACERSKTVSSAPEVQASKAQLDALPPELSTFLDEIISNTADEDRVTIKSAGSAEEVVDHMGAGMALRNGELNRYDSKVRKLLVRSGLFHRDDMSGIILLSAARRVRGEPIKFNEQVAEYRNIWAEEDKIAPTDVTCPLCKQEMEIRGPGHPPEPGWVKNYFQGECPSGHYFWYYHTDGWRTAEEVEATFGEPESGANRRSTASKNSDSTPAGGTP
ncbi:MAG: DUF6794 domain-containing protein [bacterium]